MAIKVGELAPDIETEASDGKHFSLAAQQGRHVVLFFYPKSFTGVCTKETASFGEVLPELTSLGASVLGISTDNLETQCAFSESLGGKIRLLPDPKGHIGKAYGVLWPVGAMARRVSFVVGPDQRVEKVVWHELSVSKHTEGVLTHLREKATP